MGGKIIAAGNMSEWHKYGCEPEKERFRNRIETEGAYWKV